MNKKDSQVALKRLSHDSAFYNNVFKKSEKIASVILYVQSFTDKDKEKSPIEKLLEKKSFTLHEASLSALHAIEGSLSELHQLRQSLLEVSSSLELAVAARAITPDIGAMMHESIDQVQRYLNNHYLEQDVLSIDSLQTEYIASVESTISTKTPASKPAVPKVRRQQRVSIPTNDISSDAYLVHSQLTDRAERIKTVLEAKPQASVKDVAEIITDVSEKTIQRELNSLIEKGQVKREGERRWSRYSVIKD